MLGSFVWFVEFLLLRNLSSEPVADLYQTICLVVFLCSVTMSLKEGVADPTWVQSTIATRRVMI